MISVARQHVEKQEGMWQGEQQSLVAVPIVPHKSIFRLVLIVPFYVELAELFMLRSPTYRQQGLSLY